MPYIQYLDVQNKNKCSHDWKLSRRKMNWYIVIKHLNTRQLGLERWCAGMYSPVTRLLSTVLYLVCHLERAKERESTTRWS
jgi:hypothetical protein